MKKVKEKERKRQIMGLFTEQELMFLNRKIDKNIEHLQSRAAILRHLVRKAMIKPMLLER